MRSESADLPLHYGKVPEWLAQRMSLLGGAIVESIVFEYGKSALLQRMSNPFWFQALGCVLGMDWHSSGITTSVMGALKYAVNKRSTELGVFICGGRGKYSRQTPAELLHIASRTGLDAETLIKHSRLAAKVDNTALQDGYQLYLHNFILTSDGEWAVIQQGMNGNNKMARRYHWHSPTVRSFIEEPHSFIYGKNQGLILNLTHHAASKTRSGILRLVREDPAYIIKEVTQLHMPRHHEVQIANVNLKRLGAVLALAHDQGVMDMESLLLLEGVGPRTIQSLTLISEVIHGTPSRFSDPARFSFAHGGKDGHPFPVPVNVYDESVAVLEQAVKKARLGEHDKAGALKNLSALAARVEDQFFPNDGFDDLLAEERANSWKYGGRTVMGKAVKPDVVSGQLCLF